ncbi:hypothetical protein [Methylobacterium isbiliense]|uniref:Glycosyl hydrolase family 32 N-terminal domain-containing protein n=1 Tax=Methylobacterium isbiliense TaxID=315478 RepID=A0ABQ4SJQ2_9HYPH|nr:hypothetical protein [Methylobacterium isbiliense]MDN3623967.1 hypothetical protein [Methylobacterium isbiliense]GJE02108.1 hypothetical protein GMJLKIPL_4052 [Methylobacterium isbiliense]
MRRPRLAALVWVAALLAPGPAPAQGDPPLSALTLVGPAQPVFRAAHDACDGHDVPDAPARAFRDAGGGLVLFGLHYRNRALRGPDFDRLRLDCRVVLESGLDPDPARYDDRTWITATWTEDGRSVAGLLHHEYHGEAHPGRCIATTMMACWYNTVLAARSTDGGARFARAAPPVVVAGAPFRQEVDQGRHRGFFNPSNIVREGRHWYFLAATTGWAGQPHGVCVFRSDDAGDPGRWRAHDGQGFTLAYADPYRKGAKPSGACRPVGPFPGPVGSVSRHRGTGAWIAVFQAAAGGVFPRSGFYWTTSRDLMTWDTPRLLLAGATLYDDYCKAGGGLISYPSLIDRDAKGRNFDDVGDSAELYYATLPVTGCTVTGERDLVRRPVAIKVWP